MTTMEGQGPVINRRTQIVLVALVLSMTLVSLLLLLLEPRPAAPHGGVSMLLTRTDTPEQENLFPADANQTWSAIVICDSGALEGSGLSLNRAHEKAGIGALAYHFVLGNGTRSRDGQIDVGIRWRRQLGGALARSADEAWLDEQAIGLCLIGDFNQQAPSDMQVRRLVWLVRELQDRYHISRHDIYFRFGAGTEEDSVLFPYTHVVEQLK